MKNTKRFLAAVTALAIVSALAPVSAVADNNTKVSYNYENPEPTYTVTIPASITLSDSESVDETITAEDVANLEVNGKKIVVTLDSASNDNDTDTTFHALNGTSDATYTITAGTAAVKVGSTVAEFTADGTSALTFSKITLPDDPVAGEYSETLTFGISLEDVTAVNPYSTSNIGDVVTFGDYSWYIIGKSDDGVTLLMEESFENRAYNSENSDITWENCSLRTYLNNGFYNSFSDEDKAMIVQTHNSNPDNGSTSGGENTDDYIYLLSIDEASALNDDIRICSYTWWLRSPGRTSSHASCVTDVGNVGMNGYYVNRENGVRPALNLKF